MENKENKVPEYTRRAIDKYRQNHKRLQMTFTMEEIERLKAVGLTGKNLKPIIMQELERREAQQKGNL